MALTTGSQVPDPCTIYGTGRGHCSTDLSQIESGWGMQTGAICRPKSSIMQSVAAPPSCRRMDALNPSFAPRLKRRPIDRTLSPVRLAGWPPRLSQPYAVFPIVLVIHPLTWVRNSLNFKCDSPRLQGCSVLFRFFSPPPPVSRAIGQFRSWPLQFAFVRS